MTKSLSLLIVAGFVLIACDKKDDQECIDTFGDDFVAAFNAAPNSEPVDAQSIRGLALTPTIEPCDV